MSFEALYSASIEIRFLVYTGNPIFLVDLGKIKTIPAHTLAFSEMEVQFVVGKDAEVVVVPCGSLEERKEAVAWTGLSNLVDDLRTEADLVERAGWPVGGGEIIGASQVLKNLKDDRPIPEFGLRLASLLATYDEHIFLLTKRLRGQP